MKKIVSVFIIMLMIIVNFTITSNAQGFNFVPDPTEKEVVAGETVEIKLSVKDIEEIEDGVNTIVGFMEYEEDLFSSMQFNGENSWTVTYNNRKGNSLYGKFAITTIQNGVQDETQVATLKLTLKDTLPEGETEIKFNRLVSSDGTNSIQEEDRVVKLYIKQKTEEKQDTPKQNDTPKEDTPKKKSIIPGTSIKTGDQILMYIAILAATFIVLSMVLVVASQKKKQEAKKDSETNNNDKE